MIPTHALKAMVQLLRAALRDPANAVFAFFSESCVPVHSFDCTYNFFFGGGGISGGGGDAGRGADLSFVLSWPSNERRALYRFRSEDQNEGAREGVDSEDAQFDASWRKGSQWAVLR